MQDCARKRSTGTLVGGYYDLFTTPAVGAYHDRMWQTSGTDLPTAYRRRTIVYPALWYSSDSHRVLSEQCNGVIRRGSPSTRLRLPSPFATSYPWVLRVAYVETSSAHTVPPLRRTGSPLPGSDTDNESCTSGIVRLIVHIPPGIGTYRSLWLGQRSTILIVGVERDEVIG